MDYAVWRIEKDSELFLTDQNIEEKRRESKNRQVAFLSQHQSG